MDHAGRPLEPAALQIIQYPHPTLRHKSKPVRRVDQELRDVVREMFSLMYQARGVGLAANQVDLPLRLFIVNLGADPQEGEELVFINPVITHPKGLDEAEEGCLSLPGLYGQVRRPKQVHISAYGLDGKEISLDPTGLFARVVQHELDHLDGVLFTDRLTETGRLAVKPTLEEFELAFQSRRDLGEVPSPDKIAARLAEWEGRYC
jgi:peptide deformylase